MKSNLLVNEKDLVKNSNIAIYFNYALGSPPLELHTAAIYDLLERDNEITVYTCNKELSACTANFSKSPLSCMYCKYRTDSSLSTFKEKVKIVPIDLSSDNCIQPSKNVSDSLKLGVMSSIASAVKAQSYNELNNCWKGYHDNMLNSAFKLYSYFHQEIDRHKYQYIFMFNGRFGEVKPVLESAIAHNIGYGLYEVKKSLHDVVFVNELVHSIDGNTRKAIKHYVSDITAANKNAKLFFESKVKNKPTGDPVYTKSQQAGLLPVCIGVNPSKKVIAIYPTTDDEYKFIGSEWDGFVPEDQVNEIEGLAKNISPSKYILVVKMHPNQANTAEDTLSRYTSLENKYEHLFVEPPLSKKDTYALMKRADYIVNFASTIGVEACYAKKVVIMIGDTTFSKMKIGYRTISGKDAANLINTKKLKPKSSRGAIIWGNYLSTYSDGLSRFRRLGNGDYVVDGKNVGRSRFLRLLQLPSKLFLEISKPGHGVNLAFFRKAIDTISNLISGKWKVR